MKRIHYHSAVLAVFATLAGPVPHVAAQELPANIIASTDAATRADQRLVYGLIHQYERSLNAGNTDAIVDLFAADGVAEWNEKPTFVTRQQKVDGYNALFQIAKFSTAFAYDAIDVYGNVAIVRTHHPIGAAATVNGKSILDYNREVFVLRKQADGWKIIILHSIPIRSKGKVSLDAGRSSSL